MLTTPQRIQRQNLAAALTGDGFATRLIPDVTLPQSPWIWVVAILLLAAALRIINAGHFPVWTDEGWTTWAISDHQISTILGNVAADRHPPLFFLALSAWSGIAGDSRIALRFLSIMAGLLVVALTYRIGTEWFGGLAGLGAAALIAALPSAVYYSQEIRNYEWLTLSVVLMSYFFLRSLRQPSRQMWIAYAISTAFMLYTLYIGVFILIVQGGIGLLAWHGSIRQKLTLVGSWVLALILYLPWLFVLISQLRVLGAGVVNYPNTLTGLSRAIQDVLSPQYALIGGLVLIGLWQVISHPARNSRWLGQMTLIWSGVGLFLIMVLANFRVGTLSNHTLAFLTPYLALIGGYGLITLTRSARVALMAITLIALIGTPGIIQPRLDYVTAAQTVAADYSPGDLIVLETGWDDDAFRYELIHALGQSATGSIITTLAWVNNYEPNVPVVPKIEPLIAGTGRVWVVNWLQPSQMMPFLDKGGDSFTRVIAAQTSVGAQYLGLFPDPTVRESLYERSPAIVPRTYGDLFTLDSTLSAGEGQVGSPLHIDLWWVANQHPPHDYSASVFLLDSKGALITNQDGPPGTIPTSQWTLGVRTFDRHTLQLPATLPAGDYRIGVSVYWYADGKRLPVSGPGSDPSGYAIIGHVQVSRSMS